MTTTIPVGATAQEIRALVTAKSATKAEAIAALKARIVRKAAKGGNANPATLGLYAEYTRCAPASKPATVGGDTSAYLAWRGAIEAHAGVVPGVKPKASAPAKTAAPAKGKTRTARRVAPPKAAAPAAAADDVMAAIGALTGLVSGLVTRIEAVEAKRK